MFLPARYSAKPLSTMHTNKTSEARLLQVDAPNTPNKDMATLDATSLKLDNGREGISTLQLKEWANGSIHSRIAVDDLTVHEVNKEQPLTTYVLKRTKRGSSKLNLVDIISTN